MATKRTTKKGAESTAPDVTKREPRPFSIRWLQSVGGDRTLTGGQTNLARILYIIECGDPLSISDSQLMGRALAHFIDGTGSNEERGLRVARELGVLRKQGKGKAKGVDYHGMIGSVIKMQDLIEAIGEADAFKKCREVFGIGERAMRNRIATYSSEVPAWRDVYRMADELAESLARELGSVKKK